METVGDNTAMKYVKTLKQIIDRAIDEGWIKHNIICGLKCTYKDPIAKRLKCTSYSECMKKKFQ